jgi:pimeloyl-ACP methyl ester carboxylesterase
MTENPLCQVRKNQIGTCLSDALKGNFSTYSQEKPWKLVSFPARAAPNHKAARIAAWWLPAENALAPRVVIGHGFRRNFDVSYSQYVGYLMRSMGFSALVLSYRDHGLSQNTSHHYSTWGWAYPDDLLGAWDYAWSDPDGLLGGPVEPDKVGLMGFSMGGFIAASAFGLEPKVPALWLDSAAYDIETNLAVGIANIGLPNFLAQLVAPTATWLCDVITGVQLSFHNPEDALSKTSSTKTRPVALVANRVDATVPFEQAEKYLALFKENNGRYNVSDAWILDYSCGDETHVNAFAWAADTYRQKLCAFWTQAFGLGTSYCGLDQLPDFPDCRPAQFGKAEQCSSAPETRRLSQSSHVSANPPFAVRAVSSVHV